MISSILILSLVVQFFSVLSTKAAQILGVGFAGVFFLVEQVFFHFRDQPLMLPLDKLIWSRECTSTMVVAATPLQTELKHETKCHTPPSGMLHCWTKVEVAQVEN